MSLFRFRVGDVVTYQGLRYAWGGRSGRYRTLNPIDRRGSGRLIPAAVAEQEVFPGPNEDGVYDARHGAKYEVMMPWLRIVIMTLKIERDRFIAVLDARLDEYPTWTGPLSSKLPIYDSESSVLIMMVRRVSGLLHELSMRRPERKAPAIDAIVMLLEQMPVTVQKAFIGVSGDDE
jgi:hypothetical protein